MAAYVTQLIVRVDDNSQGYGEVAQAAVASQAAGSTAMNAENMLVLMETRNKLQYVHFVNSHRVCVNNNVLS